jgi:hypothetical protein
LTLWLDGVIQHGNTRGCYDPRNFMVRWMSDQKPAEEALETAKAHLRNDVFSIVIADFYKESLCLLHFKVNNMVPDECRCRGGNLHSGISDVDHRAHHVSPDSLTPHEVEAIKQITNLDVQLYEYAEKLFRESIREAEISANFRILCDGA